LCGSAGHFRRIPRLPPAPKPSRYTESSDAQVYCRVARGLERFCGILDRWDRNLRIR
jgi:hypothetical protein